MYNGKRYTKTFSLDKYGAMRFFQSLSVASCEVDPEWDMLLGEVTNKKRY